MSGKGLDIVKIKHKVELDVIVYCTGCKMSLDAVPKADDLLRAVALYVPPCPRCMEKKQ